HSLEIHDLLARMNELEWHHNTAQVPNFGLSSETYWFAERLQNQSNQSKTKLIEVSYPILDYIDLYFVQRYQLTRAIQTGDQKPLSSRPIDHRYYLVQIDIPAGSTLDVYLRVRTEGAMQLPVELWDVKTFMEQDQHAMALQTMFAGIMLALAIYNLLILFVVRDLSYLWYVLNVVTIALVQLSLHGITFQYLWPSWPQLNNV